MSKENIPEKTILTCKDHTVSGNNYSLQYDEKKEMLVTFPRPKLDELPEFYKSEKYISHTDSSASLFDKIYQRVKSYMADKKLQWIQKEKKGGGALLDVGAGTGDFLIRAKMKGWKVFGVEPSEEARKLALEKGVSLKENTASFESGSFDVITLWHVLEHVPNLEYQITELHRLLKKNGLLIIAVPNYKSYDAEKYREYWAAYDVPRHLWHFSRSAIEKIFSEKDFKLIKTRGLVFDAFYVSMLSEGYKNKNILSPLKGFFTGLLSNLKALNTSEYSSIAYFIQKK